MAGAGQPFYMPLLWPVGNVVNAISMPADEKPAKNKPTAKLDLIGHLTSVCAVLRSCGLAYLLIYCLPGAVPGDGGAYPAFGPAKEWSWGWVAPIIARNVLSAWVICGLWDWFLYMSPLAPKLHKYKLNPKYPTRTQIMRDVRMTTSAVLTAAGLEIWMCRLWATGAVKFQANMADTPWANVLAIATLTHWRVVHFWFVHRVMHDWKHKDSSLWGLGGIIPDIGKVLYTHVHSLHHKSYNPTAFSGTNMHPVESTAYFSAALIPVCFGAHPLLFLATIVDCAVGAWLGHDGFQWPGSGDLFHQLHHAHFDCNFGAMHVPIDAWLGTYAGCRDDVSKIWGSLNKKDTGYDYVSAGAKRSKKDT